MWIGQWNSTYKNSLQWEAERKPMKKDWEIYRDTGILGGYMVIPTCRIWSLALKMRMV